MAYWAWLDVALGLLLAPLLPAIIARTKAVAAGRQGPPLLQPYRDLAKLLRKGAVYSSTTTWVFRAGPTVGLAATMVALTVVPAGGNPAPVRFPADFVLFAYLLALQRFFTVTAALDTGSSFEGMGASREVQFAALVEPTLMLGLVALARQAGAASLSGILALVSPLSPEVVLVAAAVFVLLLCENARVPFDDPNTHLELTMVHEVMVLDHSGPDLAFIHYAASLKLWLWSLLVTGMLLPPAIKAEAWMSTVSVTTGIGALAVGIGLSESTMARLRLTRVPHALATATALAAVAFILMMR